MRFSILLPTRNRLDLLRLAVQTVLDQDFEDWEVVVSDNASEEDVAGFVRGLADERVRYVRTDTLIPVTENWQRALDDSRGDYAIMLGDDDGLMRGCLSSADALLRQHGDPDVLFTDAVQFAYPGVLPESKTAFSQFTYTGFMEGRAEPFWLDRDVARAAVEDSLGFTASFPYNMQYTIFSRRIVERLAPKGPFFQSPYPDYYAANVLFLVADRILVCPTPLIVVGISPKSFGFYYFNRREGEGVEFLHNVAEQRLVDPVRSIVLPGTEMNTSWLLAMEALVLNYGAEYGVGLSPWKYRFDQFRVLYLDRDSTSAFLAELRAHATLGERLFWWAFVVWGGLTRLLGRSLGTRVAVRSLNAIHRSHRYPKDSRRREWQVADLLEFVRSTDPHDLMRPSGD